MIKSNEKDEILQELRMARADFDKFRDIIINNKPYLPDNLNKFMVNNGFEIIGVNLDIKKSLDDLKLTMNEMYKDIIKLENRVQFYYNHIISEKYGYDIEYHDNLTHNEDELFHVVIDYICIAHSMKLKHVDFHKKVDDIEFDCIAIVGTASDRFNRLVGIEFKENDIDIVIEQAIKRNKYTNLQYIVVETQPEYILKRHIHEIHSFIEKGIGIIGVQTMYHKDSQKYIHIPTMLVQSAVNTKVKTPKLEGFSNA